MEQSSLYETASSSGSWEIPHLLLNTKVHDHFHKSLQLDTILSHFNPGHISCLSSLRSILILFCHLQWSLRNSLFPSGILAIRVCHIPHLSDLHWFDHANDIKWRVWIMKLLIMHFSSSSYWSPLQFTLSCDMFSDTLHLCSFLSVRFL
jgi:hypothetical protein